MLVIKLIKIHSYIIEIKKNIERLKCNLKYNFGARITRIRVRERMHRVTLCNILFKIFYKSVNKKHCWEICEIYSIRKNIYPSLIRKTSAY